MYDSLDTQQVMEILRYAVMAMTISGIIGILLIMQGEKRDNAKSKRKGKVLLILYCIVTIPSVIAIVILRFAVGN